MPAYIVAYAYTDYLQYAGPLQTALRDSFQWQRGDYWFPEIRSLGGAAFVFIVVLYPYVYLLARTAFLARTAAMMDAARSLGQSMADVVASQLAAGAPRDCRWCAAGIDGNAADYGAASYFGLQTFTTSIYRAWFSLGDRLGSEPAGGGVAAAGFDAVFYRASSAWTCTIFTPTASQRPAARAQLRGRAVLALWRCARYQLRSDS